MSFRAPVFDSTVVVVESDKDKAESVAGEKIQRLTDCDCCGGLSGGLKYVLHGFNKDCPSCTLLLEGLVHFLGSKENWQKNGQIYMYTTFHEKAPCKRGPLILAGPNVGRFELFIDRGSISPFPTIGHARIAVEELSSSLSVGVASDWLKECYQHHALCQSDKKKPNRLPTRVIHTGSDYRRPFIYESNGKRGRYVALSYCWGDSLPLITTSSTLKIFKKGIPLSRFPATLRDAILVARAAGIKYLWIDALCILQDSTKDWATESARMGDIFANAYFVISADAAVDCQSGFLSRQQSCLTNGSIHKLKYADQFGHKSTIFMRPEGQRALGAAAHSRTGSPSRLSTRAWVFQERVLANRTLIFAQNEMAWECRSTSKCECSFKELDSLTSHFLSDWKLTVETYSALRLTKISDRLPAFTGIAKAYKTANPGCGNYLAGLWSVNFTQLLLWYVQKSPQGDFPESQRQTSYHAPSWSWASISGPVRYHHQAVDALDSNNVRILKMKSENATSNTYGAVASAHFRVRGPICAVQIIKAARQGDYPGLRLLPYETRALQDEPPESFFIERAFMPDVFSSGKLEVDFDEIHYFLHVLTFHGSSAALILRKSRQDTSAMERVGFCCFSVLLDPEDPVTEKEDFEKWKQFLKFTESKMSERTITVL